MTNARRRRGSISLSYGGPRVRIHLPPPASHVAVALDADRLESGASDGPVCGRLLGPPGTELPFPIYEIIDIRHRDDVVLRGTRVFGQDSVGFVKDCHWVQHYENIVDPWHLFMLPRMISGDQFEGG